MKSYVSSIISEVLQGMQDAGQIADLPVFEVTVPKEEMGDYSSNIAFVLAKTLKENPKLTAEKLSTAIAKLDTEQQSVFATVQPVGGFINFFLSHKAVGLHLKALRKGIEIEQPGLGKKIVFEYSSPNTNKALH